MAELKLRLEGCAVHQVTYTVFQNPQLNLATFKDVCVIALDAADVVDQIRRKCVGAEINYYDGVGNLHHGIADYVVIESVQCVGRLHGITDDAYLMIMQCVQQERAQ